MIISANRNKKTVQRSLLGAVIAFFIGESIVSDAVREIVPKKLRRCKDLIKILLRDSRDLVDDLIQTLSVIRIAGIQDVFQLVLQFNLCLSRDIICSEKIFK